MKNILKTFLRDEDGAALVEYGLALLVVILVGTTHFDGNLPGDTSRFSSAVLKRQRRQTLLAGAGCAGCAG
jgi:Flp pilus assembly pilin Flp